MKEGFVERCLTFLGDNRGAILLGLLFIGGAVALGLPYLAIALSGLGGVVVAKGVNWICVRIAENAWHWMLGGNQDQ